MWLGGGVTVVAIISGSNFGVEARDAMLLLLAASMGAQLAAIRYLKVPDLLTVVLTLTITGALTERRGWADPASIRRALALVAFAFGALTGALLILNIGMVAALVLGLAIIIACTIAAHLLSQDTPSWAAPRPA